MPDEMRDEQRKSKSTEGHSPEPPHDRLHVGGGLENNLAPEEFPGGTTRHESSLVDAKAPDVSGGQKSMKSPSPWPARRTLIAVTLGGALCVIALLFEPTGDRSANNILALIGIAVATTALVLWVLRSSACPAIVRRGAFASLLLLLLLAVAVVRIDQVTGDMVPTFRFVWTPPRDARLLLNVAPQSESGIDLVTTAPDDFPQFLGPDRTGVLPSIGLDPDWHSNPPRQVWKQPIGAGWSGFATVNGFAVTLEQRGDEEMVTCYAVESGQLQWVHAVKTRHESILGGVGPRSTPTIHQGRVYALGATGILRCLDGGDGSLIWSKDLLTEFGSSPGEESSLVAWGRAASPLIVDSLVVVPAGGPRSSPVSLVAYDMNDGVEVWRGGSTQVGYSSPILAELSGVPQILIVNESSVSGHRVDDGGVLWSFPWSGSSTGAANTSQPLVIRGTAGDESILVSKGYAQGTARFEIRRNESQDAWDVNKVFESAQVLKTKMTSAVQKGDYAYGLSDGILECVAIQDGQRQWKNGRYGHGQLLLVGDHLLILTENGDLALVEAAEDAYRELHRVPALTGKTWNTVCLHGTRLLIRNAEEAACYELAVASPN